LEARWHAALRKTEVTDAAMHVARARFDQPAVFGRRCPHEVDRLAQQAAWRLERLDLAGARQGFSELLALDPHNVEAQLGLGDCALREGDVSEARERYVSMAEDTALPRTIRARAREAAADLALA